MGYNYTQMKFRKVVLVLITTLLEASPKTIVLSKYFCRYCLIRRDLFAAKNGEYESYEERTIELYNNALKKIEQDFLEEYQGVKFNSVFNKLSNFHV